MKKRIIKFNWTNKNKPFYLKIQNSKYTGHNLKLNLLKRGININSNLWEIPDNLIDNVNLELQKNKIPGTIFGKKEHNTMVSTNISGLIKINAYRGRRIKNGLPARGQKTRTNGKTAKKLNRAL